MAIYFLRHGECVANLRDVFAGQRDDSDLTDLGVEQAIEAGKSLSRNNIVRIVSSNLIRARKTAEIVASQLGFESEIIIDSRLAEYDLGLLTGCPRHAITSTELVSADEAEDPAAFMRRVTEAIREYKDMPGNTLVVSHAGVGRIYECARIAKPLDEFYDIPGSPNASVVELDTTWL